MYKRKREHSVSTNKKKCRTLQFSVALHGIRAQSKVHSLRTKTKISGKNRKP